MGFHSGCTSLHAFLPTVLVESPDFCCLRGFSCAYMNVSVRLLSKPWRPTPACGMANKNPKLTNGQKTLSPENKHFLLGPCLSLGITLLNAFVPKISQDRNLGSTLV